MRPVSWGAVTVTSGIVVFLLTFPWLPVHDRCGERQRVEQDDVPLPSRRIGHDAHDLADRTGRVNAVGEAGENARGGLSTRYRDFLRAVGTEQTGQCGGRAP